jgi:ABC-2 type transport system ATP-binding protein
MLESVYKRFCAESLFGWRTGMETRALHGITFRVRRGEVLGLLGPNGSGKTTALKLISTVLLPDKGCVWVKGFDTRLESAKVRQEVGFALASERSFFPRLTAVENLQFFAAFEDVPRREQRARLESILEDVGLQDAGNKVIMKFSSGMMQRLAIARALIKQPSVLLLDEPTRSLDPAGAETFWLLVRELSGKGITIVLATHSFSEAAAVCDRIAILLQGELRALRTVSADSEDLREFYFAVAGALSMEPRAEGVPA